MPLQIDPPTTAEFLARTRPLSVTAIALLGLQVAGNLYEEVVTNPQVIQDPRPGALPGELDVGSPVFFYMPWSAVGVIAAVALRVRHGADAPARTRRAWNGALACLGVVAGIKSVLISRVNPRFRDPAADPGWLRDQARLWQVANGVAVLAGATAVGLLAAPRRLPVDLPG